MPLISAATTDAARADGRAWACLLRVSRASVVSSMRPKKRAQTAAAAKLPAASFQPRRMSLAKVRMVGWEMKTVRMAMPRTPPSCRALEFTADAVA